MLKFVVEFCFCTFFIVIDAAMIYSRTGVGVRKQIIYGEDTETIVICLMIIFLLFLHLDIKSY